MMSKKDKKKIYRILMVGALKTFNVTSKTSIPNRRLYCLIKWENVEAFFFLFFADLLLTSSTLRLYNCELISAVQTYFYSV